MHSSEALLDLLPLRLQAGGRALSAELRLQVLPGQRWGLIGRNGAGKSTLLRLLAGLSPAGRQQVRIGAQRLDRLSPAQLARRRAYLPALPHDRFGIRVLDAVLLAQREAGVAQALHWLQRLDAQDLAQRSLLCLSAGERQRVALAQVLAQETPLLLLDEPASFQDPRHQAWLLRLLRDHVPATAARALVFSAHDVNWVAALATHVLALLPDLRWVAGSAGEVLRAATLEAAYGCAWERVAGSAGDLWLPLDNGSVLSCPGAGA